MQHQHLVQPHFGRPDQRAEAFGLFSVGRPDEVVVCDEDEGVLGGGGGSVSGWWVMGGASEGGRGIGGAGMEKGRGLSVPCNTILRGSKRFGR